MKKLILIIVLISITFFVYSQHIGIRVDKELSDVKIINNSFGFGIYIIIDDFSEKIETIFSFDFNKVFEPKYLISSYQRISFGLSCLYVIPIKEKLIFKTGLGINYNMVEGYDNGIFAAIYYAKFIGIEFLTNLHFKKIFNLPLNFDLFITPNYLINIYNNGDNKESANKFYYNKK